MKNKFIKYTILALALNMSCFITIIPMDEEPRRVSMCKIITATLLVFVPYATFIANELLIPCPNLPKFHPKPGTQVKVPTGMQGRRGKPTVTYKEYDPATMEIPNRYSHGFWGNCVLATTYKKDKKK